ncbi:pellicle/biofilm biosynthesis outer membrane protein PelC [Marinobacter nanhaiticus D15-8W]|nr:hypothetical protein [Marinobacter nanhaiticus]BES73546.1 pellicle/biofilm biosynthesis outer membrane protein PelC [Marinobacter nanhaiticus D15-8W]
MKRQFRHAWLLAAMALALFSGCAVMQSEEGNPIPDDSTFAVVPLVNLSQTPQAGEQAASVLAAILRAKGSGNVTLYLPQVRDPLLFDNSEQRQEAITQARSGNNDYLVSGTVEEWRYKSGLDGEPAVGVTLEIRSADDQRIVWSGTAARTGWGRESLSVAAHKVIDELADAMPLVSGGE